MSRRNQASAVCLPENGLYNLNQAAAYMGKSPVTVRRWTIKGNPIQVPHGRAGRDLRFKKDELDRFMFPGRRA